jgi:dTDP-4-amino-4,6-dideoxygalactose transaminase
MQDLWSSHILSNQGPKHRWLEQELRAIMHAPHLTLFCNGTLALALGLRALEIKGEVITTHLPSRQLPFHHLNGAIPVFVDVDPVTLCIDPAAIKHDHQPYGGNPGRACVHALRRGGNTADCRSARLRSSMTPRMRVR